MDLGISLNFTPKQDKTAAASRSAFDIISVLNLWYFLVYIIQSAS